MSYNQLRFIGGGRWAFIVLNELIGIYPELKIDWICNSELIKKNEYIKNLPSFRNVKLVSPSHISKLSSPDKVIIASHSSHHCSDLSSHRNSAQILIEKPIFPFFQEFKNLSDDEKDQTFINLEFYYAYFITDFYNESKPINLEIVEIIWHDPLEESRDGSEEKKYSEVFSSIFMDQLLHVISIFKALDIDPGHFKNIEISIKNNKSNGSINIECSCKGILIKISLSRFAEFRERKVIVNNGAISLDFTSEPIINKNGNFYNEILIKKRLFPIAKTLDNFISFPEKPDISSLSLRSLSPGIRFCFECEDLFTKIYSNYLDAYNTNIKSDVNINPYLTYYAGICYYKNNIIFKNIQVNQYLKGTAGVKDLISWWKSSISQ